MNVRVLAAAVRAPGVTTPEALRAAVVAGRFLTGEAPVGERPERFPAGAWRRTSRLSRLVAAVGTEVVARSGADPAALVSIWGTAFGELDTTTKLLERMFREGPDRVSPSAFQTSLFGTPLAHLSMALGLTGESETVCAGGCSSSIALMRGIDRVRAGAPAVLVIAGDEQTDAVGQAWALSDEAPRLGEAVAALVLGPGGEGPIVDVVAGHLPGARRVDDVFGLCPAGGLALAAAGCDVAETDGASRWTITVRGS